MIRDRLPIGWQTIWEKMKSVGWRSKFSGGEGRKNIDSEKENQATLKWPGFLVLISSDQSGNSCSGEGIEPFRREPLTTLMTYLEVLEIRFSLVLLIIRNSVRRFTACSASVQLTPSEQRFFKRASPYPLATSRLELTPLPIR